MKHNHANSKFIWNIPFEPSETQAPGSYHKLWYETPLEIHHMELRPYPLEPDLDLM